MSDTRRAVLDALADGPVPGPTLAGDLGVSRSAVWKHVEALREAGFEIASGDAGYELVGVPAYGGAAVEFGLDAPFSVEYHDAVGSTNDRARELAADGAADVVVLADEQTGGRGRLDRGWSSPSGGVWASLVLRPDLPPSRVPALTLAAAVAATDAAREAGVPAEIKWPNDVLVSGVCASEASAGSSDLRSDGANEGPEDERSESSGVPANEVSGGSPRAMRSDGVPANGSSDSDRGGRKLAGVLTEMEGEADRVSWVVVGIGVNADIPAESLPEGATSLRTEVGGDVDRRVFVQRLLERFDDLRADPEAAVEAWRERAATLGQRVRIDRGDDEIVGTAVDVAFPGALVVETEDGRVRVHAGDCEHLRPA